VKVSKTVVLLLPSLTSRDITAVKDPHTVILLLARIQDRKLIVISHSHAVIVLSRVRSTHDEMTGSGSDDWIY
jgi:hypothetical protein